MPQNSFSAQIKDWVLQTQGGAEAVFKQSVQDVLEIAQQGVPVDTGYLRGSLTIGINSEPGDIPSVRSGDAYVVEILPARLGDTVMARWVASYAAYQEYGTSKMAGRGFVRKAVQQWPEIVKANEAKLGARLGR